MSANNVCEGPRGNVSGHVSATNVEVNVDHLGLGTLVKKVIVTNVLEPIFSLNVNTTNFLSQSPCPLHTFSLQVKAKPNEEENCFQLKIQRPKT